MSRDSVQRTSTSYSTASPESKAVDSSTTPISPYSDRPMMDMATLPPPPPHFQQQDPYRPHHVYDAAYSQHAHAYLHAQQIAVGSSGQPPNFPSQPAPRQRTAIACRYCRRRKIRCHGFDSSPDGRCTNCLRFNQECIFTPVSSQAHAFVPAHTAYPYLRNARNPQAGPDGRPLVYAAPLQQGQQGPPLLYGAHGQPLGPVGQPEPGYGTSPPQGIYAPGHYNLAHPPPPPPPAQQYDERSTTQHAPLAIRRPTSSYEYPDPTHMAPASPASSALSYQKAAYTPSSAQPYYTNVTPSTIGERRTSPTGSYFSSRPAADSPHAAPLLPPLPSGLHPPQALPPASYETARNSSPTTPAARTGGMSVADMLAPASGGTRSSTDSDMLNAFSRHRR